MLSLEELKSLLAEVLQVGDRLEDLSQDAPLMGGIPEFDSMAVVYILTAFEDQYGIEIEDDEVSAEHFETLGNLLVFVNSKLA